MTAARRLDCPHLDQLRYRITLRSYQLEDEPIDVDYWLCQRCEVAVREVLGVLTSG